MINAKEAAKMSMMARIRNEINSNIDDAMNYAMANGEFECRVNIPDDAPLDMISELKTALEVSGYMVQDFTVYEGDKYIKIFWGDQN